MKNYLKFVAEVAAAIVAALIAALTDNTVGATEWINVVIVGLGAVAVLGAGNLPAGVWSYTKSIVAASTAVAVLLASLITDGITSSEWLQLALAAAGALGVGGLPGPVVERVGRHSVDRIPGGNG